MNLSGVGLYLYFPILVFFFYCNTFSEFFATLALHISSYLFQNWPILRGLTVPLFSSFSSFLSLSVFYLWFEMSSSAPRICESII